MGAWHCCETRNAVNTNWDGLKGEVISVMGELGDRHRLVRCTGGCIDEQRDYKMNVDEVLQDVINHLG